MSTVLSNFDQIFEIDCDTANTDIGTILSVVGHTISFSSEKLNDSKLKYLICKKEFYAIVHALDH